MKHLESIVSKRRPMGQEPSADLVACLKIVFQQLYG